VGVANITVVGAGEMGRATLGILTRRLPEARFAVLDRSEESLRLAKGVGGDRIDVQQFDATRDQADLSDTDIVLNFAGPFYSGSDAIASAAVAAGCHYVDICDDIEGARPILELGAAAAAAGTTLITGAGGSPGITNLMAKRLMELHPETDGIRVVWVANDADPGGLAPLRHMLFMAVTPCPIWQDGEFVTSRGFVPGTAREHDLPAPVGRVTAYDTSHTETLTLPRQFPDLRHVSVQGSLWPAWANEVFSAFGRVGFGYPDLRVEVGGAEVEPVEVLWKVLWARHGRRHSDGRAGFTALQVQALVGDDEIASLSMYDPWSMVRQTAIGAAAVTLAVLHGGTQPGAFGPEVLDAERTLSDVLDVAAAEGAIPGGFVHATHPRSDRLPI
jgi:saccharopine dehydrogenase-like NADP-dependent oxidoreductase